VSRQPSNAIPYVAPLRRPQGHRNAASPGLRGGDIDRPRKGICTTTEADTGRPAHSGTNLAFWWLGTSQTRHRGVLQSGPVGRHALFASSRRPGKQAKSQSPT
jgi:hypothetical protein